MITYAYVKNATEKNIDLQMPDPKGCSSSEIFKTKPHEFRLKNSLGVIPKKGDIIKLEIDTKKSIFVSLLIFIFPLVVFSIVFFGLSLFFMQSVSAAGGLLSLSIAFFTNFFILKSNKFDAKIVEISKDTEIEICKSCNKCKN